MARVEMWGLGVLWILVVLPVKGQVMEGVEVSKGGCEGDCGTLFLELTDGTEEELKGTQNKVKVKDVEKARVVGTGCFMIFKSKDFKSSHYKVDGTEIHNLKDKGVSWTTVK